MRFQHYAKYENHNFITFLYSLKKQEAKKIMSNQQIKVDNLVRISPMQIGSIVRAHWNAEPKVPINIIGEPSTAKSEGIAYVGKEIAQTEERTFFNWNKSSIDEKRAVVEDPSKYFIFADMRASETDIGELRLQDMMNSEDYMTFKYNIVFKAFSNKHAMGILFFDEMNLATNMIKAQFYKIINDRAVGDIPISDGVLCISAGNEAEHARGVTEDPVPLVLRRGNYFLRPLTAEEYTDYAARTNHHRYVLGYLGFQPNDVHNIAYDLPDSVSQPCPRSWTKLSSILKANPKLSLPDIEMIATGMVGQGVAKKFTAYVKSAQNIDLNQIIKNPELIKKYQTDDNISLMYAIISGVVEKFRDSPKEIIEPAIQMTMHTRAEFGAFMLRALKNANTKGFMDGYKNVDEALMKQFVDRYAKFLIREAN